MSIIINNRISMETEDLLKHCAWLLYKGMMSEYDPLGNTSTFGQYWDEDTEQEIEYNNVLRARDVKNYLTEEIMWENNDYIPAKRVNLKEYINNFPIEEKDIKQYHLEYFN